jgi:hypothetical protein
MPRICQFFSISIYIYYNDHRAELRANWERASASTRLQQIEPLE